MVKSKLRDSFVLVTLILVSTFSTSAFADDLTTLFNSEFIAGGNMFDVVALSDVVVRSFDGNYSAGTHTVEIWHRPSSYAGFDTSSIGWTLQSTSTLTSSGPNTPTAIPATHTIKVPKGETHAFYITAQTAVQEYSSGTTVGSVLASDSHIQILEGAGIAYPFAATFEPRNWNGTLTYTPITNPPAVFVPSNKLIAEDGTSLEDFSVADSFYGPDELLVVGTSSNTLLVPNGNISITPTGATRTISVSPAANASGSTTISIRVTTPSGRTILDSFVLTVSAVNDAPVANSTTVFTTEDTNIGVTLVANDVDNAGLTFAVDTPPAHGTLLGSAPNFTYQPDPNYSGADTFTFHANDGLLNSNIATVSINIAQLNDLPTADSRSYSTLEDVAFPLTLTGDDVENSPLTFSIVNAPTHGFLSGTAPNLNYTPNVNYSGADSFTFRTNDGSGNSPLATISISISPVNDAPRFVAPTPNEGEVFNIQEGQLFALSFATVDVDGDPLSKNILNAPTGSMFNPINGSFSWTPSFQEVGQHSITISVSDALIVINRSITIIVTGIDNDNDGLPDNWELQNGLSPTTNDSDNDQISDLEEVGPSLDSPHNSDNDATIDALDSDSDNDGLSDLLESGDTLIATPAVNSDNDSLPDYRDVDSDDDTVNDDTDNCRLVDNPTQTNLDLDIFGDACDTDIDGDGLSNDFEIALSMNHLSTDSDQDSISDAFEIFDINNPRDFDNDQTIDALDTDSDNDGFDDSLEAGDADLLTDPIDTDNDTFPDYVDLDSDEDTIIDADDNCRLVVNTDQLDNDADGSGDICDMDFDGDGIADTDDNCPSIQNVDQADLDSDNVGDLCDSDLDGDQINNSTDNCPTIVNADQADLDADEIGDLCDDDIDGDGVLDVSDNCPLVENSSQDDLDEDGQGDLCDEDIDGDNVENDNCPLIANRGQEDEDGDGEGDLCDSDFDGDGVDNEEDNCPELPNTNQFDSDSDGIGDACDDKDDALKETSCGDGFDDDGDDLIDCKDPDCSTAPSCKDNDIFEPSPDSEACACRITKTSKSSPWLLFLLFAMVAIRRVAPTLGRDS